MSELNNEYFNDLIKDTEFKVASVGSLMHSRKKVKTPLIVLNCIYGGGLPLGILSEISGVPSSGKSTFLYQCMGNYQSQYPEGVPVIYDMEASMDNGRLKQLGIDTTKVLRLPSTDMEDAFSNMFKMLNKLRDIVEKVPNISSFQIYDSISAGGTSKQHDQVSKGNNAFGAGTMMEPQRIMKQNLSNVLPYMEEFPIFLGLINQVFTQTTMYGSSVNSGGGYGLKHLCHSHISFSSPKDDYEGNFIIGTRSTVELKKSKLSPKMIGIPCYIDVTKGGIIDEEVSFYEYLINIGMITTGSWYKLNSTVTDALVKRYPQIVDNAEVNALIGKNIRKNDLRNLIKNDNDLCSLLQVALIEYIDNIYPAQKEINEEYENKIASECKFLQGLDILDTSTGELIGNTDEVPSDQSEYDGKDDVE